MREKLSVVIPIYKVEAYLRQCLDSVTGQTYQNLEIILVDDGSPDRCGEICDEYAARDERIVVIHKQNGGLSAARNDGIRRATGEWITFVDSDDWLDMDYYEQMFLAIPEGKIDIFCSGGYYRELDRKRVPMRALAEPMDVVGRENIDWMVARVLGATNGVVGKNTTGLYMVWDKFYRAEFVKRFAFDTTSHAWEDVWFNFCAFDKAERIAGCTCVGYHYRQNNASIANAYNENKPKYCYDFSAKLNKYMNTRQPNETIQKAINAVTINALSVGLKCSELNPACPYDRRTVAKHISEMKTWKYYHQAIYASGADYLRLPHIIVKYLLRLPWAEPLMLYWSLKERMKRVAKQ